MEWIEVLCTFLTLVCDIQLIIVGTLPFIIPKVLWLTQTHLSTCAGLIASLVVVVTIQLLKAGKMSANVVRIYKYSFFCRRLIVGVAGGFHLIAILLTICGLFFPNDLYRDFKKLMLNYLLEYSSKELVDNIQFALQCCGGHGYEDWFHIDWCSNLHRSKRKALKNEQPLEEDANLYVDITAVREDAVPFSCCDRSASLACVHQNLAQLGTSSINTQGCEKKLHSSAQALLWFELTMYIFSLALEVAIFMSLSKLANPEKPKGSRDGQEPGQKSNDKYSVSIEWIGTLCTYLIAICDVQLITTGFLIVTIPDVLWLTGSHLSTGAGLMASLVALPTALRLKTAQTSPNIDRIYGYTLCYQRLAICVSGALHLVSVILTIIALIIMTNLCKDFKKLMRSYHLKQLSKTLIDNIQFALQCCGGHDYEDWFDTDWEGFHFVEGINRQKHSVDKLLKEDTDAYPDLVLIRSDAVPFSCCLRSVLSPCIHQNLIQLGSSTISKHGCGKQLRSAAYWLLWFEFFAYSFSLALEVAVLLLLKRQPKPKKAKNSKTYKKEYENFLNGTVQKSRYTTSSESKKTRKSSR